MVGPGTVHVHGHLSVGATGDVVEENCRAAFTHARQRAAGGREIRFEFHLFGHAQQLLLAVEYGQKLAKILISTHRDTLDVSGRCVECRGLARPACEWISNRATRMSQLHDDRIGQRQRRPPGAKIKISRFPYGFESSAAVGTRPSGVYLSTASGRCFESLERISSRDKPVSLDRFSKTSGPIALSS